MGAGPIGLCIIEILKAAGAEKIFVMQRNSIRQEYGRKHGADYILDPSLVDVPHEVLKETGLVGVDVAIDTTGAKIGLDIAVAATKSAGTSVITSIWEEPVKFDFNSIVFTEKKLVGSIAYYDEFPATIKLIADRRINTEGFITKKIPLDEIVENGFGTLTGPDKKEHVKIMVTPDKTLL